MLSLCFCDVKGYIVNITRVLISKSSEDKPLAFVTQSAPQVPVNCPLQRAHTVTAEMCAGVGVAMRISCFAPKTVQPLSPN